MLRMTVLFVGRPLPVHATEHWRGHTLQRRTLGARRQWGLRRCRTTCNSDHKTRNSDGEDARRRCNTPHTARVVQTQRGPGTP